MTSEPAFSRLLPVVALCLTTVALICLILIKDHRYTGSFRAKVITGRATVSIAVQLVSSMLGLIQTYVACTLINFASRLHFAQHSIPLKALNLWTALSTPRLDFSLPWRSFGIAALFLVTVQIPGALWAGAISPILTTATSGAGLIRVPAFTDDTKHVWDGEFDLRGPEVWNILDNCKSVNDKRGFVTSCPVPDLQALLLRSASTATTMTGAQRIHPKLDSPNWVYHGRSYGVASSQGLVPLHGVPTGDALHHYNYTESGYRVDVKCVRNSTADFGFSLVDATNETNVATLEAGGYLPNSIPGNPERYPVITWYDKSASPEILAWAAVVDNNQNMIAIAAGGEYASFNQTQCAVHFSPAHFSVSVNVSDRSIEVSPADVPESSVVDIDPSGRLKSDAVWSVNLLSRMSTSLYRSVLGDSLKRNLDGFHVLNDSHPAGQDLLDSVEASFTAIIDDILVAFGTSQLIFTNASEFEPITASSAAMQIGKAGYIFATLGVNLLLIAAILFEIIRTRWWRNLLLFNPMDIKTVVVAASGIRGDIANEVRSRHAASGTVWAADPKDAFVSDLRIQLLGTDMTTIALDSSQEGPRRRRARAALGGGQDGLGVPMLDRRKTGSYGEAFDDET